VKRLRNACNTTQKHKWNVAEPGGRGTVNGAENPRHQAFSRPPIRKMASGGHRVVVLISGSGEPDTPQIRHYSDPNRHQGQIFKP